MELSVTKLLVIDDEQSILETLRMVFEEKGLKVLTADTGAKGMDQFTKENPQVVILDIRLPDINGLDILQTMINTGQPVKIIMITAFQDGEMERLRQHTWKGNVRELENTIVQALVGCRGNVLLKDDIDRILNQYRSEPVQGLESFSLAHVEKKHITRTLSQLGWNKSRAARLLQITLPALRADSKIKSHF